MPTIEYLDPTGTRHEIDSPVGQSVADAALRHGVPGIVAECGGSLSCATCHVYVVAPWIAVVGPPEGLEDDMLDEAMSPRLPSSRLSCQLDITPELHGLCVVIPPEQQ